MGIIFAGLGLILILILSSILVIGTKLDQVDCSLALAFLLFGFLFFSIGIMIISFSEIAAATGTPANETELLQKNGIILENLAQFETPKGLVAVVRNPEGEVRFFSTKEKLPEKFVIIGVNGQKQIMPYDGSGKISVEVTLPAASLTVEKQ